MVMALSRPLKQQQRTLQESMAALKLPFSA